MRTLRASTSIIDEDTYEVTVCYEQDGTGYLLNQQEAEELVEFIETSPDAQEVLTELHRVTKAILNMKSVKQIVIGSEVEDVINSAMYKAEILNRLK